mmetsp:Transcript_62636/g.168969  ORF Transcript_62636/g.168969 Transcript_62636/m.168969 type:complete len:243 (+) Transcript_62636:99-827(+)
MTHACFHLLLPALLLGPLLLQDGQVGLEALHGVERLEDAAAAVRLRRRHHPGALWRASGGTAAAAPGRAPGVARALADSSAPRPECPTIVLLRAAAVVPERFGAPPGPVRQQPVGPFASERAYSLPLGGVEDDEVRRSGNHDRVPVQLKVFHVADGAAVGSELVEPHQVFRLARASRHHGLEVEDSDPALGVAGEEPLILLRFGEQRSHGSVLAPGQPGWKGGDVGVPAAHPSRGGGRGDAL